MGANGEGALASLPIVALLSQGPKNMWEPLSGKFGEERSGVQTHFLLPKQGSQGERELFPHLAREIVAPCQVLHALLHPLSCPELVKRGAEQRVRVVLPVNVLSPSL